MVLVSGIRDRLGVSQYVHESPTTADDALRRTDCPEPGEASEAEVDEADINILMYTSGTTGRPKGSC